MINITCTLRDLHIMAAILADGKFMLFEETFRFQLVNIGPGNGLALSRHQANA